MEKESCYSLLYPRIREILAQEAASDIKTALSKVADELQNGFGFLWTGFYFVETLPMIDELRCVGKDEEHSGEEETDGSSSLVSKAAEAADGSLALAKRTLPWLVLGPSVGPPACEKIRFGRGVCGTSWAEARTIIVADVDLFPGHIACSSESRSEIVVPIFAEDGNGKVIGVLDIDSGERSTFDETDAKWLEAIVRLISSSLQRQSNALVQSGHKGWPHRLK